MFKWRSVLTKWPVPVRTIFVRNPLFQTVFLRSNVNYLPPASLALSYSTRLSSESDETRSYSYQWLKNTIYSIGLSLSIYSLYKSHCVEHSVFPVAHCTSEDRSKKYNFLAEAVDIASPSVVYIENMQTVRTIFGEIQNRPVSSGSGFVVHDGTFVLTNAHVVGSSRRVNVKIPNGKVLVGKVQEVDTITDLALIKLDVSPGKIPAAVFGSSSSLRPGEWVIALGSPLNLTNTTTAGIVSTVIRPSSDLGLEHHKPDMEYVQTDALITTGNSGGPLVNVDGEVIGVNTMTAGPGISFAIPSDFAKDFLQKAIKKVKDKPTGVTKYGIGASCLSIGPLLSRQHEIPEGVLLAIVWPNGPASSAGLARGDVIVKSNGRRVSSVNDLNAMVQEGKEMRLEVIRNDKPLIVKLQPEPLYLED